MESNKPNKLSTSILLALSVFFLLGVIFIVWSSLIDAANTDQFVIVSKGLLAAIGQTFIASSTISLFLSIKSIRDYFLTLLAEVMTGKKFLSILSPTQLDVLHDSCHDIICRGADLHEDRLQEVNNRYHLMFKGPFCEEMRESIDCHFEGNYIIKKFRNYFYLKNQNENIPQKVDISQKYFLNIPNGGTNADYFRVDSLSIEIDGIPTQINYFTNFEENNRSNYNNYNTFVHVTNEQKDDFIVIFRKTLKVEIAFSSNVEKTDVSYTKRLRYPTKSFILNFSADKNVVIVPQFFGGFINREEIVTTNNGSNMTIECNKLALPGSGAIVVLNKKENSRTNSKTKSNDKFK